MPQRAIKTDLTLHDFLARGLGNSLLTDDYETNRLRIAIIQNARPFVRDRIVSAMEEHLAIIAALEAGDPTAAAEAIRVHFKQTLRWWGVTPSGAAGIEMNPHIDVNRSVFALRAGWTN